MRAGTMRPSLFQSGLVPRLTAAVLFGVLAFGAVALLEPVATDRSAGGEHAAPEPVATPAAHRTVLCIDSLRPVAAWTVRVDGVPVQARTTSATIWLAELTVTAASALVIDATPAAGETDGANALRIRIAGTPVSREQTFWCARDWSIATRAGALAPAVAPIDPEDLP
ncbi:MAG: hypothetical protein IAE82_10810 [Opitutaceae bacterium]|nr:hypothetical protein [Opitutaceae bacterium]